MFLMQTRKIILIIIFNSFLMLYERKFDSYIKI